MGHTLALLDLKGVLGVLIQPHPNLLTGLCVVCVEGGVRPGMGAACQIPVDDLSAQVLFQVVVQRLPKLPELALAYLQEKSRQPRQLVKA